MDIPGFKLGRKYADEEYCRGYNALNLGNQKTVNIQVFNSSLVANEVFSSQFRDVTSKMVGTSFGIMAPTLQAVISDKACYVVSKYFPSPQQLSATPPNLTRHQVLQFALQLAQTLDQLHKVGLVHGGIEYSSLYFSATDKLILRPVILQRVIPILRPLTFKSLERAQKRYLAPEAIEGLTPATDFYALGVLLYQLIINPAVVDTTDTKLLEEWPSVENNQGLKELVRQLLAPDASLRIQSLDQFTAALQQCGVDILESAPTVSKATYARRHRDNDGETASRSFAKWIVLTAGLVVTVLVGAPIILSTLDEAWQWPELDNASEVVASADTTHEENQQIVQPPSATLATIEPVETSPSAKDLYQQALTQMETDPEAALLNVKVALNLKPGDVESLKLKRQIENELEIRSLINRAEQQLAEQKLHQPSGDNAYETYQTLAEKLPTDDERVRSGFTHIAAAYHSMAQNHFTEELYDKALEYVEMGLSVEHDYPPLHELRISINEQKKALQRELKLAQLEKRRNSEQQNLLKKQQQRKKELQTKKDSQEKKEPQGKKEQHRLVKKQAAVELNQRQEEQSKKVARQTVDPLKQVKVEALLRSANDHLNNGRLTLKSVFAAHLNYDELRKLDSNSQSVTQLKKALINAYALLADRQPSEKLYKLAIQAIEQGVQMSPEDRKQLQIRSQLSFSSF
jgi:serine/threonine protein kinase